MGTSVALLALILGMGAFFLSIYLLIEFKVLKREIKAEPMIDLPYSAKRTNYENIVRGEGNITPAMHDGLIPGEHEDDELSEEDFSL